MPADLNHSLWLRVGLMSMPGAGLMADRFSKDKKADETKDDKDKKSTRRKKEEDNDFGNKVETPLLSEYMSVQGNNPIVLRGVGLVTGLNGTGGDPLRLPCELSCRTR